MDLAEQLSAEDKAYFGEEAIAEALAGETGAPVQPETEPQETTPTEPTVDKSTEKPGDKPADSEPQHKTVPLAALHEERERRKELAAEVAQHRERTARMEERLQQFMASLQKPPEEPKSVDEDPMGALRRIDQTVAQSVADQRAQREAQERETAQQQQYRQLSDYVTGHEAEYRKTAPDYDAAVAHLTASRAAEYEALGVPQAQIAQLINNDAVAIASQAARTGRNPAEVVYAIAKQRGYAPKAAESTPAATEVSGEEKMAMLEKGTAAAKSLSAPGGGNSDLSLEALASMDDDEFGKISETQWRKLWGER